MFDWISDALDLGLDYLFDGGSDYVGDLAVDLGSDYVGDLAVDLGSDYVGDLAVDLGSDYVGGYDYYGPAGTINQPLADGQYGPAGTISVPDGGIPYNEIPNYGTYPGDIGGGGASLRDVLGNLARAGTSFGRSAGAGGSGGVSMPSISAPSAAGSIGAHPVPSIQTGAMPAPPSVPEYRPNFQPVPLAQGPRDDLGLRRLLDERGGR